MQVDYVGHYGDDLFVANCARVSFAKWHEEFKDNDNGLISFLARENHFMPFCHPHITMRVKSPIFIARQCQKHQIGFSWSEESRRYVDYTPDIFSPEVWRRRPEGNIKQGSGEDFDDHNELFDIETSYQEAVEFAVDTYNDLLYRGVSPEMARMVLPQSAEVTWIWTGSLAAWARAYKLRIDAHAQKEIQDLAKMWGDIIEPLFPVSWKALTKERKNENV